MPYDPTKDPNSRATYETARNAVAVAPSDTADLTMYSRCLYVGGDGDVTVVMVGQNGDAPITFPGVVGGTLLPIQVRRVMATGTTATALVALN